MRLPVALALVFAAALPAAARAALPPEAYAHAREDAPVLLTLTVTDVVVPASTPGGCRVEGAVASVSRDATGRLAAGQPLGFDVACARDEDDIPAGGTRWTGVDDLERASLIRAWLAPEGDGYRVVLSQSDILASERTPPTPFPWGLVAGLAVVAATALTMLLGGRARRRSGAAQRPTLVDQRRCMTKEKESGPARV